MREVLAHTLGSTIAVSASVPPSIPSVIADQPQLETAIINLGTNARDAMPDGGTLLLSAEAEDVAEDHNHPAGLAPGDYVRLSVADNGTGMDAAILARVTEPFFTTKPLGQGTGLGLSMAKGFAEQSGGGLSIVSTPGKGTTVTIWLRQAASDVVRADDNDEDGMHIAQISARVLLVDDDDLVRETLADSLENAGFSTLVASNGLEALTLIESGEVVDAMVSDLSMPGMNGVTTIQKVRALRPRLPCFLITGYVGERAALSAGDDFTVIRKPVPGQFLAAQIEVAIEGAKR
jgi:CheY-like chemotaxis protein